MAKSATGALLATIEIERDAPTPIYRQIENCLRRMILDGALPSRQKLPSTREFAQELGVSRITVKTVYEQLISEGYAEAKTGAGTFVSDGLVEEKPLAHKLNKSDPTRRMYQFSEIAEKINSSKASVRFGSTKAFRPGVPALDKFPIKRWNKYVAAASVQDDRRNLSYGELFGSTNLRRSIATHLADARGMNVDHEQIIITSGAQQAFVLISIIMLNAQDTVWYENPGHIAGRDIMSLIGANIAPISIDKDGLDLAQAIANHPKPKLIFTTPSHQQPLGITMSLRRRLALLKYAFESDAWIIEDDYDSEFRYRGRPLPALSALDKNGRVLYVGTFSKSLCSAARLGYVVVPHWLVQTFAKTRNLLGQSSSPVTEEALSKFINDGRFAEHIRKMRRLYRDRRDMLLACLLEHCHESLIPQQSDAGMHIIADLKHGIDDQHAHQFLLEHGIDSLPLSVYCIRPINRSSLVLGFSGVPRKAVPKLTRKMGKKLLEIHSARKVI